MGNPDPTAGTFLVLIYLAVTILIFLVCREIVCWYFKFNKIVELTYEQNRLLRKLLTALTDSDNGKLFGTIDNDGIIKVTLRSKPKEK